MGFLVAESRTQFQLSPSARGGTACGNSTESPGQLKKPSSSFGRIWKAAQPPGEGRAWQSLCPPSPALRRHLWAFPMGWQRGNPCSSPPGASLGSQFCSGSRVCPGGLLTLRAEQPLPEHFKVFALNPKGRAGSTGGAPGKWGTGQPLASPPLPQKQQRWGAPATQHWEQMTRRDVLVRSCCSPFSTTPCSSPALELSNATDPRAG